jgi:hypothetical protein
MVRPVLKKFLSHRCGEPQSAGTAVTTVTNPGYYCENSRQHFNWESCNNRPGRRLRSPVSVGCKTVKAEYQAVERCAGNPSDPELACQLSEVRKRVDRAELEYRLAFYGTPLERTA